MAARTSPKATDKAKDAPASTAALTFGKFTFSIAEGVEVPAVTARPPSNPSPWPTVFTEMAKVLKQGSNVHAFVPDDFWSAPEADGGRGAKPESVAKTGYVKTKLRDAFRTWQEKDKPTYNHVAFIAVKRKAGDIVEGKKVPVDGCSYWLEWPKSPAK